MAGARADAVAMDARTHEIFTMVSQLARASRRRRVARNGVGACDLVGEVTLEGRCGRFGSVDKVLSILARDVLACS